MHIAPFFYLGQADREEESGAKSRIRKLGSGVVRRVPSLHASIVAKAAGKVT